MERVPARQPSWWEASSLIRDERPCDRSREATNRFLQLAAGLEPGARLSLLIAGDGEGKVTLRLSADTTTDDLDGLVDWVGEGVATWTHMPVEEVPFAEAQEEIGYLAEIVPTVQVPSVPEALGPDATGDWESKFERPRDLWPMGKVDDAMDLLQALASTAGQMRVHLAPASDLELQMLTALMRRSVQSVDLVEYAGYLGAPVRIRAFVAQAGRQLSPRLRAALGRLAIGVRIVPRDPRSAEARAAWNGARHTLAGSAQPFGVAQCLVRLPACGERAVLCGVPTAHGETSAVPLEVDAEGTSGLRLGTALGADGRPHEVRLAPDQMLLHTQVLGATGTGKSTLLAAIVQEAVAGGMGVSVIESHGPLVERIAAELPVEAVNRTIMVRCGDLAAPVPVNPLNCGDSAMVSEVLVQVMRELLDPKNQGFLGPRFERIFGQMLRAQRELFGDRTNLAALPHFLRSREQVKDLALAVKRTNPALATELMNELVVLSPDNFGELIGWVNAKYQRLTATPELRAILQTGYDAVDVTDVMDERRALLVDLAAPAVGPLGAQFLGEIWLAKHWAALARRKDPSQPHLLILDEAHLFASGLLPRLLAEARKFGVGVVLAHQHLEQLTEHLRDASLATTSNVIVFRSGPREAATSAVRLGSWAGGSLTRLPRFHAAATLSLGREQSDAFSLFVDHNDRVAAAPQSGRAAASVAARTLMKYSEPYRRVPPITSESVDERVRLVVQSPTVVRPPDATRAAS